ncbi:MAG: tetratricopeptide repeat protein [Verrucomicrobiales bacterium]
MSPPNPEPPTPDSVTALSLLAEAGNPERLEREAARWLQRDPEDPAAHFYRATALLDMGKPREAGPHVEFLRARAPEDSATWVAAASQACALHQWRSLRRHLQEGMRLDPQNPLFYRLAAVEALQRIDLKSAKSHIKRARDLDPNDANTAALHIRIHGVDQRDAVSALTRLEESRQALELEPENAALWNGMGDIYLQDLDDPAAAEPHYREALRLEPGNKFFQRDLFHAVARRSLVYQLFSIPSRTFGWLGGVGYVLLRQPWRLILLVFAMKLVAGFFLWLLIVSILFWPGGKVYEWLLVSEIRDAASASNYKLRTLRRFHRWPLWVRFGSFLLINMALWSGLFRLLGMNQGIGFAVVGAIAGFHFLIVSVLLLTKRLQTASARRALNAARGQSV